MIYHKFHKIPLYFGEIHIFVHNNFKEVNEKFNLGLTDDFYKGYEGLVWNFDKPNGYSRYFILLEEDVSLKVIVHESKHLVNNIFNDRGIKLDLYNDEPECYLLGWVFETIQKDYEKFKKSK